MNPQKKYRIKRDPDVPVFWQYTINVISMKNKFFIKFYYII